jgi:3D (Asp-Asp-Asp) domain-containing protein
MSAGEPPRQRSWLIRALTFLWWGGSTRPGSGWMLAYGLALGFIVGVLFHMRFNQVSVIERVRTFVFGEKSLELPKPVTPPPPGMVWAKALTTGYCPCDICCEGHSDGRTAINRKVIEHPYGIAVDPKLLPYRINLMVPGYGYALVDDTGGAMRQDAKKGILHLDLRFSEHSIARTWGRRWMWIAIPEAAPAASLEFEAPSAVSPPKR